MRSGVLPCAVLGLGLRAPASAEPAQYAVRGEAGVEYDSNAGRIEQVQDTTADPVVGSAAARVMAGADVSGAIGNRQTFSLAASAAAKGFMADAAGSENVAVGQVGAAWNVLVARRTTVGLAGGYYDVFQGDAGDPRAFRSVSPTLRLEQGLGENGLVSLGAGPRWFSYKPEPDFDFSGPSATAAYRVAFPGGSLGEADWEVSSAATFELRRFAGGRCLDDGTCPSDGDRRRDQFWTLQAEATRTGSFLAGGGVAVHGNASNSYGEPLLRGILHGRAVWLLPWQVALSARAELVATRYYDSVPLARDEVTGRPLATIEEESRSLLRVELARPVGGHMDAGVRYTYYTNEITGGPVRFRRHTALVFLAVSIER